MGRSQYTTKSMVLAVICFVLCKWIAIIFAVIAYEKAEQANSLWGTEQNDAAIQLEQEAQRNYNIGLWVAIVCFVLEIVISTIVVLAFIALLNS